VLRTANCPAKLAGCVVLIALALLY
jgi:hypothetical protein